MPSEHRENPFFHYGEPIAVAAIVLVVLVWSLLSAYARYGHQTPVSHPPTVINDVPSQEGDVIEADRVRRLLPWWEVKTGEKALFKRRLPHEGASPDQASYELYVGQ